MNSEKDLRTSKGIVKYSLCDFFKEIGLRPVIWDKDHINRRNRFMAWHDVIRTFVPFFDDLSFEEQTKLTSEMRNNWKCITNVLMKTIKLKKLGDPKYRPYRYAHHLEFYLNHRGITLDEVATAEEFKEIDENEKKRLEKLNTRNKKRYRNKVPNKQFDKEDNDNKHGIQNVRENIPLNDSTFDPILFCETTTQDGFKTEKEYEIESFENNNEENVDDPHQDFFDSIRPTLNKLNCAQKLDFKILFLETLKKYQQNI